MIKEIQREIGITTVYVTHDQEEAMAISDRIAVMNKGEIQQVGTPRELYHRPANLFVASFIGRTNVLKGELYVKDGGRGIVVENRPICLTTLDEKAAPQAVSISIRPEDFTIAPDGSGQIKGRIKDSVFLGLYTHYEVLLPSGKSIEIIQQSFTDTILEPNSEVSLAINTYKINVFDAEGTRSLMARGA